MKNINSTRHLFRTALICKQLEIPAVVLQTDSSQQESALSSIELENVNLIVQRLIIQRFDV